MKTHLFALVLAFVLTLPQAYADDHDLRTVSVKGEAIVKASPNKADLSINLFGKGKTASEAKKESDKKLTSLYQLAKKYKLNDKAIRTNQSSMHPQYDYRDGKRIFRHYQSQHRVTIEIDDLDIVADLSDALVEAGVDRIESLQYGLKDSAAHKQQALVNALQQAKKKAAALAKVADAKLGDVLSINEQGISYRPPSPLRRTMMKAESTMAADSPVAPPAGEVEIRQTIHAVFELE